MRRKQNNRCRVCGVNFAGGEDETLDHVIPFRLVGDVPSGANWQLLCPKCNGGKGQLFSFIQSSAWQNWIYGKSDVDVINQEARYVLLSSYGKCARPSCSHHASSSQLFVVHSKKNGLPIVDHLAIYCENCCSASDRY